MSPKPTNNALMLPSKERLGIALIALGLIVGGGWLIQRNINNRKRVL